MPFLPALEAHQRPLTQTTDHIRCPSPHGVSHQVAPAKFHMDVYQPLRE